MSIYSFTNSANMKLFFYTILFLDSSIIQLMKFYSSSSSQLFFQKTHSISLSYFVLKIIFMILLAFITTKVKTHANSSTCRFAAEVFHGLQEQVMTTASRSHNLMVRVQHIETALPPLEKVVLAQTSHIHFAYTPGRLFCVLYILLSFCDSHVIQVNDTYIYFYLLLLNACKMIVPI